MKEQEFLEYLYNLLKADADNISKAELEGDELFVTTHSGSQFYIDVFKQK